MQLSAIGLIAVSHLKGMGGLLSGAADTKESLGPSTRVGGFKLPVIAVLFSAVAIIYSITAGFILEPPRHHTFIFGVVALVMVAGWIWIRKLRGISWWAALISLSLAAPIHILHDTFWRTFLPYVYNGGEFPGISILQRVLAFVVVAGFPIFVAELLNRKPARSVRPQVHPDTVASLQQVGTTEDGRPLYVQPQSSTVGTVQTNTLAILALIFGILGGIIAIPLGHVALHQIKQTGAPGRGLAIAGLVLGYLWLALIAAYFIFILILVANYA